MKRIIVLECILVFAFSAMAYATASYENNIPVAWKPVIIENTSGAYVKYSVPTTTIPPNKSVLGYVIVPIGPNCEAVVGLYDGPGGASIVSDELFDEAESDGSSSKLNWFPYPRKILTQLNVHVGPNTRVLIYWE